MYGYSVDEITLNICEPINSFDVNNNNVLKIICTL